MTLDGLVQRRDAEGRLVEEASFNAGRLDGPFRLFGPNGELRRIATYRDGLAHGLATDYDDDGKKLAATHWLVGQRHGEARLYAGGRLAQVMEWRQGKLDGPLRVFAPSGALQAVMPHREGRLHGTVQLFDPEGRLLVEAEHMDGLRHGVTLRYAPDGTVAERVTWVAGRPEAAEPPAPAEAAMPPAAADPLRSFYTALAREGRAAPDRAGTSPLSPPAPWPDPRS